MQNANGLQCPAKPNPEALLIFSKDYFTRTVVSVAKSLALGWSEMVPFLIPSSALKSVFRRQFFFLTFPSRLPVPDRLTIISKLNCRQLG